MPTAGIVRDRPSPGPSGRASQETRIGDSIASSMMEAVTEQRNRGKA